MTPRTWLAALLLTTALVAASAAAANISDNFVGTAAGTGTVGYSGDGGPATTAEVHRPRGIDFLPGGGAAFAESNCHTIRTISATGVISTLAGTPDCPVGSPPPPTGGYMEGIGPNAAFRSPWGVVASPVANVLYLADSGNSVIRRIDLATATTSLVAGIPGMAATADGVPGQFNNPTELAIDPAGVNLYVAQDKVVRRVQLATGNVQTLAGSAAQPAGNVDDATGTNARFGGITGLATDGQTLWVADEPNHKIRAVALSGSFPVTTVAGGTQGFQDGTGAAALIDGVRDLELTSADKILFVDGTSSTLRRFDPVSTEIVTLAGTPYVAGRVDGFGAAVRFISPRNIASSGIHWLISDTNGNQIRGELPPPAPGSGGGNPGGPGPGGAGAETGGGGGGAGAGLVPSLRLTAKSRQRVLRQRAVIVTGACDSACTLTAAGTLSVPGAARSFRLRGARRTLGRAGSVRLRLAVPAKALKAARRALARRRRVSARVTVRAGSSAGSRSSTRRIALVR